MAGFGPRRPLVLKRLGIPTLNETTGYFLRPEFWPQSWNIIALRVQSCVLKLELIPYLTRNPQPEHFSFSSIPPFPPGRRPYGPEANWGEAPNLCISP